jgi:hypothetical protein
MLNLFSCAALALGVPTLLIAPANFGDVFVDASASCAVADGSEVRPFCTVAEALGVAVDGDVLHIASGTYAENLFIAEDLTLLGTSGAATTILDGGLLDTVVTVESGATVAIDGLTLTRGRGFAGGLRNLGSVTLRNSTLSGNVGEGGGSGAAINHRSTGTLDLESCELLDNIAVAGSSSAVLQSSGVTVYEAGAVRIVECSILGGSGATSTALRVTDTRVTVESSVIASNAGDDGKGAVWVVDSLVELTNSTISGNEGLAVFHYPTGYDQGVSLRNCTVIGNGGPIESFDYYSYSPLEVRNSIVAGNGPGEQMNFYVPSAQYSLISTGGANQLNGQMGNIVGTTSNPVDPLVGPLAMNGGTTLSHALLPGSPAIGAGAISGFEAFDQTGKPRTPGFTDMGSVRARRDTPVLACTTVPNSTGSEGTLSIGGSNAVNGMFTMSMAPLPPSAFGFFLVSSATGLIANPGGSFGNLCLTGEVGRYVGPGQIQSSGEGGIISATVDPTVLPQPTGFRAAQSGETWYFQGWFRDVVAGTPGSNFAQAVGLTFL